MGVLLDACDGTRVPSVCPGVNAVLDAFVSEFAAAADGIDGSNAGPAVAPDGSEIASLTFGAWGGAVVSAQAPSSSALAQSAIEVNGVFMKFLCWGAVDRRKA